MRISDWSSDVCSSDLAAPDAPPVPEGWEGCSLSEVFELQPDEDGRFPVLRGLTRPARFDGQRVRSAQTAMTPADEALCDATRRFTGFSVSAASETPPSTGHNAVGAQSGRPCCGGHRCPE